MDQQFIDKIFNEDLPKVDSIDLTKRDLDSFFKNRDKVSQKKFMSTKFHIIDSASSDSKKSYKEKQEDRHILQKEVVEPLLYGENLDKHYPMLDPIGQIAKQYKESKVLVNLEFEKHRLKLLTMSDYDQIHKNINDLITEVERLRESVFDFQKLTRIELEKEINERIDFEQERIIEYIDFKKFGESISLDDTENLKIEKALIKNFDLKKTILKEKKVEKKVVIEKKKKVKNKYKPISEIYSEAVIIEPEIILEIPKFEKLKRYNEKPERISFNRWTELKKLNDDEIEIKVRGDYMKIWSAMRKALINKYGRVLDSSQDGKNKSVIKTNDIYSIYNILKSWYDQVEIDFSARLNLSLINSSKH